MENFIKLVGVNDHDIDLFESQYVVKDGISYNSYLLFDKKIALFDTVEKRFFSVWLANIKKELGNNKIDYLIISHVEPDHSSSIVNFLEEYPDVKIVGNALTFKLLSQFYREYEIKDERKIIVKDMEEISLGNHTLKFITAPFVHWPEVLMSYVVESNILFCADAFGQFGANDSNVPWLDQARKYYIGIVGKYGDQVQSLFKKLKGNEIKELYPLHGHVLDKNIASYLYFYNLWSTYTPESSGAVICYSSIYGNTKNACEYLYNQLVSKGVDVKIFDLARCDIYDAISFSFKYKNIVIGAITYNMSLFPKMEEYLSGLVLRNFQSRNVYIIQNGSWAPVSANLIKQKLQSCKNINYFDKEANILSSLNDNTKNVLDMFAASIVLQK